ncbi:MAG: PQQ-binding-like beta-propeller repeat protein [Actinomycetota bacterium]
MLALVVASPFAAGVRAATTVAAEDWPMFGGNPSHHSVVDGPAPPYRRVWLTALEEDRPRAAPIGVAGALIVVAEESVVALDASTGAIAWEVERARGPAGSPATDGQIVVHAEDRGSEASLLARRLEDGEEVWKTPVQGPAAGGLTLTDGLVFVGLRSREVVALDVETGDVVWTAEMPGRVDSSPAVADGLAIVAPEDFADGDAAVVALDVESGEELWQFAPEGARVGVSSASIADDTVYVGLGDGSLRALDAATGTQRWRSDLRLFFSAQSAPAGRDPLAVVDRAGHAYALDRSTGVERWVFRLPGSAAETSPVVIGEAALVGDSSGQVSAIDLASGLLVWKAEIPGEDIGAVAPVGDRLYVASEGAGGAIVAFEHDPNGVLLEEPSPTTLFPLRALANFAGALVLVTLALLGVFRIAVPAIRTRRSSAGPGENGKAGTKT